MRKSDFRIDAKLLRDQITSRARTVLLVLLAASALIFVIACSNVANLILARSVRREGELAIRAALGAGAGALRRRCSRKACCSAASAPFLVCSSRCGSCQSSPIRVPLLRSRLDLPSTEVCCGSAWAWP